MTPGAYIDAILECLGGGLDGHGKVRWLNATSVGGRGNTRLERVLLGEGVWVLAEAARNVDGMVAT